MDLFDLYAKITLDDGEYRKKIDDASKKGSSFAKNLGNALKTGVATLAKATVAAATAASAAVVALGKIGLDYNSQMEDYTTNFTTMLGSVEAGAAKVEELKKLAAATPFSMGDLSGATQTLLAFNVASDDSTDILTMLGDISLGNADKLSRLSVAYGKVNSTGKLTGETLQQMIEAGFNPAQEIIETTGETMEEFQKRMSKGEVSAEELNKALKKATSQGGKFKDGMKSASKTMTGLISTLKDNAQTLIGRVFKPISESLTKTLLPAAISAIDRLQSEFEQNGVNGLIRAAGEMMGRFIGEVAVYLPKMGELASSLITALLNGISSNSDAIGTGVAKLVSALATALTSNLGTLVETALSIAKSLMSSLAEEMPTIVSGLISGFADAIISAITNIPGLIEAGIQLAGGVMAGVAQGIATGWDALTGGYQTASDATVKIRQDLLDAATSFETFADKVSGTSAKIVDYDKVVGATGQTISDLQILIDEKEAQITDYIREAVGQRKTLRDEDIVNVETYLEELESLYETQYEIYRSLAESEATKISQELSTIDAETLAQRLANTRKYVDDANAATDQWYSAELASLESLAGVDAETKQKMRDDTTKTYNEMLSENESYYTEALALAASSSVGIEAVDRGMYENLNNLLKNNIAMKEMHYNNAMSKINFSVDNGFLDMLATIKSRGGELTDEQKELAGLMLGSFENLPDGMQETGYQAFAGLIEGLDKQIPGLEEAAERGPDAMISVIESFLGIASPSKVMRQIGDYTMQGLIDGIKAKTNNVSKLMRSIGVNMATGMKNGLTSQLSSLIATARNIADRVTAAFKARLDINSPSRKLRDEVGVMMARGIGIGFEQQMTKELKAMTAAIDVNSMAKGIKPAVSIGAGDTREIVLQMDGRELARFLAPSMSSQLAFGGQ